MTRCYVCRRLVTTTTHKGHDVCQGCIGAVARVLDLEASERHLVGRVQMMHEGTADPVTRRRCQDVLNGAVDTTIDIPTVVGVLARIVDVLDPTAGKGHALETLKQDHQLTVGAQQSITYACIMPGCEVCAVVGAARELLRSITSPHH